MKSYLSLIFRYIKRDNKAYLFSFISIIIASFLVIITWGSYELKTNSYDKEVIAQLGDYTGYFNNITFEQSNIIKNHNHVDVVGLTRNNGYVETSRQNNKDNNIYLNVMALDSKSFEEIFDIDIIEGRLPKNSYEVLVNYNINYLFKNTFAIGDKIEVEVKSDINDELIKEVYEVVGIIGDLTPQIKEFKAVYNGSSFDVGEFLITYLDEEEVNEGSYRAYVKVKNHGLIPQIASNAKLSMYKEDKLNEIENYFTKKGFMYKSNNFTGIDNNIYFRGNTPMIISTVIIVAFVISISAIGISFQCKADDMNELMVIGAYKKQIRSIVLLETIIISVAATIVSSVIGCIVLSKFGTFKYIFDYIFIALCSSITIIIINIIAVFWVLSGTGKEAGAETKEITYLSNKIINIEGNNIIVLLAKRYSRYYENKNKYINYSTAIMFVVIMILFNQFSMFKNNINGITKNVWQAEYTRNVSSISDNEVEEIKSIEGVKDIYGEGLQLDCIAPISKDKYIKVDIENKVDINVADDRGLNVKPIRVKVKIVGDNELDIYKDKLNSGILDKERFRNGGLILDISSITDSDYTKIQKDSTIDIYGNKAFKIGEDIVLPIKKTNINEKLDTTDQINNYVSEVENALSNSLTLPIMALVNNTVTAKEASKSVGNLTVLMSKEYAKTVFLQDIGYEKLYINFDEKYSVEAEEKLESYSKLKGDSFYSYRSYIEKKNTLVTSELRFYLGLSIMLLIIVILNIINTIRFNITTRKEDIVLLQAIGMSKKQVKEMLILENMRLIIKACIIGSLISMGLTALSQLKIAASGTNVLHLWTVSLFLTIVFVFFNSAIGAYLEIRKI